eukprot:g82003.t1
MGICNSKATPKSLLEPEPNTPSVPSPHQQQMVQEAGEGDLLNTPDSAQKKRTLLGRHSPQSSVHTIGNMAASLMDRLSAQGKTTHDKADRLSSPGKSRVSTSVSRVEQRRAQHEEQRRARRRKQGRQYCLQCKTPEETEKWVNAINENRKKQQQHVKEDAEDPFQLEGLLKKRRPRTNLGSQWQERYFTLNRSYLCYYKSNPRGSTSSAEALKGRIALGTILSCREVVDDASHCTFVITIHPEYQVQCKSEEETKKWVDAINAQVKLFNAEDGKSVASLLHSGKTILLEGQLKKRKPGTARMPQYQERYFILDTQSLRYYKRDPSEWADEMMAGSIDLINVTHCEEELAERQEQRFLFNVFVGPGGRRRQQRAPEESLYGVPKEVWEKMDSTRGHHQSSLGGESIAERLQRQCDEYKDLRIEGVQGGEGAPFAQFSVVSQQGCIPGVEKPNQDRAVALWPFMDDPSRAFFAVFDGHGPNGHLVSTYVSQTLPKLFAQERAAKTEAESIAAVGTRAFSLCSDALLKTDVNVEFSGCTGIVVYLEAGLLTAFNVGDSRAVLARSRLGGANENPSPISPGEGECAFVPVPLSKDHKPFDPEEKARIEQAGGRCEPPGTHSKVSNTRVWLKDHQIPGLAVSRAFGDACARQVGVHAVPDVVQHRLYPLTTQRALLNGAAADKRNTDKENKTDKPAMNGSASDASGMKKDGDGTGEEASHLQAEGDGAAWPRLPSLDKTGSLPISAIADKPSQATGTENSGQADAGQASKFFTFDEATGNSFFCLASDGIFEFLSNEETVEWISENPSSLEACDDLVKESTAIWAEEDESRDDITLIVIFLKGYTPPATKVEKNYDEEGEEEEEQD